MRITPMKILWGIFAIALIAASALTLKPDAVPEVAALTLRTPITQVIALRGWMMLGFFGGAIFFAIIGAIRRTMLGRGRIAFFLSAALAVVGVLHGVTIYSRGISNPGSLSADPGITTSSPGNGAITVLQYNTHGGLVEATSIADLVEEEGIDVLTLPETSTVSGVEIVDELANRGLTFQMFDTGTAGTDADYDSTVLLVSSAMGEYVEADVDTGDAVYRSIVRAVPADGSGPDLIAIHSVAPSTLSTKQWRIEIESAYNLCGAYPNAIYSGDFNSTVDHELALGLSTTCTDAVAQAGSAGLGTWPSNLPSWLGSPIDRVMAPTGYEGTEAAIVDLGGSDHRGVVVRLTPES